MSDHPSIRAEVERSWRTIVRVDAAESRERAAALRWFCERQRSYARHLRGEARQLLGEVDRGVSAASAAAGAAHLATPPTAAPRNDSDGAGPHRPPASLPVSP
jgi:hypothetical protein